MLDLGGDPGLPQEALAVDRVGREFRAQELQSHDRSVVDTRGAVDDTHAALAENSFELVLTHSGLGDHAVGSATKLSKWISAGPAAKSPTRPAGERAGAEAMRFPLTDRLSRSPRQSARIS